MKVWVTRDEDPNGPLTSALRAASLTPVLEPVIARCVVDDARDSLIQLSANDWLVLTSVFAIEAVALELARIPRVAVVGQASAKAAKKRGLRVKLIAEKRDAESLFGELRKMAISGKVCYPRSSLVDPPDAWNDVEILSPVLYETVPRDFNLTVASRVDVVAVASPSAVDAIAGAGVETSGLRFASIGPTTSAALGRLGLEPFLQAPKRSFQSLAEAIARA